jgi:hypothetical protein
MLTPTPKFADNVECITGPKIFIRSNNISKETVACLSVLLLSNPARTGRKLEKISRLKRSSFPLRALTTSA